MPKSQASSRIKKGTFIVVFSVLITVLSTNCVKYSDEEKIKMLQEEIIDLQERNMLLEQKLHQLNLTLQYYKKQTEIYRQRVKELESVKKTTNYTIFSSAELDAPAVRQKVEYIGDYPFLERKLTLEGVMMEISVEITPGKGRVLVVTKPAMGVIFQDAANTAVYVAQKYTGKDLSNCDVIFSVTSGKEVSEVDGPSAGALMTLMVISAINEKKIPRSITMTGTIDLEGNIGGVSGIVEKAQAAKKAGKTMIFIPWENHDLMLWGERKREIAGIIITEKRPVIVDAERYIEKNIGINVEYVKNIRDVLGYMY
ncbi:MAG: S16 family serine protease [Candidatus Hydrothermarchaeota archaeon]